MFTLNLKEIELTPRIEVDKVFSNNNRFELEMEVSDYIKVKYRDVYKNPLTINRKVNDAVRDEKGETFEQKFGREKSEQDANFETKYEARKKIEEEITAKYTPEFELMEKEQNKKLDNLSAEYSLKIQEVKNEGNADQVKAFEEERDLKDDDIRYEYMQRQRTLHEKRETEIEERVAIAVK